MNKQLMMSSRHNILDFIFFDKFSDYPKYHSYIKKEASLFLITPLKVLALLIAVSGLFAMLFEVKFLSPYSIHIYVTRLLATVIAFTILVLLYTRIGIKKSTLFVHLLLLLMITSSGYMIYLMPKTLIINSQIVGLMIFTSALFLSWEIKNQIIVAIYYNLVFATAILINDKSIYFLPNMYQTVLFVLFMSIISVIGSAINFKLRMQLAEKNFSIEESEKKYKSIFENSVEGVFQTSLEGKFITVNPAFVKLLGYSSKEEVLNLDIKKDIYKYPEERDLVIKKLKDEGVMSNYRVALKRKDGSDVIVKLNDRLISDPDSQEVYLEGNIQDITSQVFAEKKRAEVEKELREEKIKSDKLAREAVQSNEIKSQFLANMSHEIRTPMNGIIGYLTLIEQEAYENKKEMLQFVVNAKQSAESLLEIINDILDLSKIESGKIELENKDFNLIDIIDKSVSLVAIKAKEKGIRISKNIEADLSLNLVGDPTRLRQIYLNLLSNAVKFTDKGEIIIHVETRKGEGEEIIIYSYVKDSGIGIPKEKQNALFKPFSQVDSSHTRKYGGTGLGLVICKEFINMMGGDINVESLDGRGTKFNFSLKFKAQKNINNLSQNSRINQVYNISEEKEAENFKNDNFKRKRGNYKILLAEDNIINQKVAMRLLNDAGFQVITVDNGLKAVEAVREDSFSLVLMDVQMPEMDGLTAASEIRKLDSPKRNIPIIAITAHALMGDKEKCLSTGMNDYITKPIIANQMIGAIDRLLSIQIITNKPQEKKSVETKTFDFAHLEKISMGDVPFQKDIIATYIEDIEKRYQKLENLFIENDLTKLTKEAHTIKGASSSIGAVKVGEEALAVEISCKHNDLVNLEIRIKNLHRTVSETVEILKDYIRQNVAV